MYLRVLLGLTLLLAGLPAQAADAPNPSPAGQGPSAAKVAWRKTQRCGLNCLYVLLRIHGVEVSYQELADETVVGDQGSTFAELSRVARRHGFDLTPMRATWESIDDWPLPAVIHLESQNLDRHYVLLLRREGEEFVIFDCTDGEVSRWGEGEIRDKWSGYVLLHNPPGRWQRLLSWTPYAWLVCGGCMLGAGALRWSRNARAGRQPGGGGGGMGAATETAVPPLES